MGHYVCHFSVFRWPAKKKLTKAKCIPFRVIRIKKNTNGTYKQSSVLIFHRPQKAQEVRRSTPAEGARRSVMYIKRKERMSGSRVKHLLRPLRRKRGLSREKERKKR
jgi:hypothetical protein